MQVIYRNNPNQWVEYDGRREIVGALVGTSQELYRHDRPGNFHWTVSLAGGEDHPLWEQNSGSEETFAEAKQAVEKFLKRL